jgi:threonylcarbamoyladenosine tRNA methylthiotransferase MtaB
MARGKSRSDKILNVLENVKEITNAGSKEIILTGVNLGDFGENGENFLQLIIALENETTIPRYRISSIEPNLLSDDIIRFVASSKRFMPHFHIPLQSGSDRILGLMRRRYKRKLYADRVNLIKALLPHASIGVDVIVGFPGETEADFQETYSFLESLPITYLHVFTYSERDNTLAVTMKDIVSLSIRQTRNKKLRQLSYQKQEEFNNEFSGTTRPVLFEKEEKTSMMEGYTDNYIRIKTPYKKDWVNQIMDWKI